jgi:hypothetical protein
MLLDEIKNSQEGHAAPEDILSDLEEEVTKMTDRYGVDRKNMSTLSYHQLQRSINKDTPPNIGAFQILEQQRADEYNNLVSVCLLYISKHLPIGFDLFISLNGLLVLT